MATAPRPRSGRMSSPPSPFGGSVPEPPSIPQRVMHSCDGDGTVLGPAQHGGGTVDLWAVLGLIGDDSGRAGTARRADWAGQARHGPTLWPIVPVPCWHGTTQCPGLVARVVQLHRAAQVLILIAPSVEVHAATRLLRRCSDEHKKAYAHMRNRVLFMNLYYFIFISFISLLCFCI